MYALHFTAAFQRDYDRLTPDFARQTDKVLELMAHDLHHPSLRTHKRRGSSNIWQVRVTRSHRIYFLKDGNTITLLSVAAHD